jgi:hypothetical protein
MGCSGWARWTNPNRSSDMIDQERAKPSRQFNPETVKPDMPVVCSNDGQFAVVDHLEGKDTIKLKKDGTGKHHFIPTSWVKLVDDKIHIDRPGEQAMKEWRTEP